MIVSFTRLVFYEQKSNVFDTTYPSRARVFRKESSVYNNDRKTIGFMRRNLFESHHHENHENGNRTDHTIARVDHSSKQCSSHIFLARRGASNAHISSRKKCCCFPTL